MLTGSKGFMRIVFFWDLLTFGDKTRDIPASRRDAYGVSN